MDPLQIIEKYYKKNTRVYKILVEHSKLVTQKAVQVAKRVPELKPDIPFIKEAGMLHDVGIFLTNAPEIGCKGTFQYVHHGRLGRELLEKEGFLKHALVCERHTGTGLTCKDAEEAGLPVRDMTPQTIEEEIICFADKFYSKKAGEIKKEFSPAEIKKKLKKRGEDKVRTFEEWCKKFREV